MKNIIQFVIPTWALSALINDDRSSLDDRDEKKLNLFFERIKLEYPEGYFSCPDFEVEIPYFSGYNDIDGYLGAEVVNVNYVLTPVISDRKFATKQNPYLDSNFNDLTNQVETLTETVLADIKNDPQYYAELITDLYFKWKHNTFETPLMVMFAESVKNKK